MNNDGACLTLFSSFRLKTESGATARGLPGPLACAGGTE